VRDIGSKLEAMGPSSGDSAIRVLSRLFIEPGRGTAQVSNFCYCPTPTKQALSSVRANDGTRASNRECKDNPGSEQARSTCVVSLYNVSLFLTRPYTYY